MSVRVPTWLFDLKRMDLSRNFHTLQSKRLQQWINLTGPRGPIRITDRAVRAARTAPALGSLVGSKRGCPYPWPTAGCSPGCSDEVTDNVKGSKQQTFFFSFLSSVLSTSPAPSNFKSTHTGKNLSEHGRIHRTLLYIGRVLKETRCSLLYLSWKE